MTITAYQDGPYLVRGSFQMLDQHGQEIVLHRRTIALCRCGKSRLRPLCDGTHRAIGFRAPTGAEGKEPADVSSGDALSTALLETAGRRGMGGEGQSDGTFARAIRQPTSQNPDPAALLALVRDAEDCLVQSLAGPCTAGDYAAMSLAEPLMTAARRLLETGRIVNGASLAHEVNGGGLSVDGMARSKKLVTRALAAAQRFDLNDDARVAQVRLLLNDAATALSR